MAFSKFVKTLLPKAKPIYECAESVQLAITSKQLRKLELLTPSQQTDLNSTRVAEILAAHESHPAFDLSKNQLTVAVRLGIRGRKTVMYLMDGQHRREATLDLDDFPFIVTFQHAAEDADLRELFRQINVDSHKNRTFVLLSKEDARMSDDLYDYLRRTRETLFKDSEKAGRVRSIREFVDALGEPYFSQFASFAELQEDFELKTTEFAAAVEKFFEHCYADEKQCCAARFLPPLRETNLVDFLVQGIKPLYVGKKRGRISICAALQNAVWLRHFPVGTEGKCTCCKVSTIGMRNFDCGHVVSVHAGGKTVAENLRPICGNCNSSMGKKDMDEFIRECGF